MWLKCKWIDKHWGEWINASLRKPSPVSLPDLMHFYHTHVYQFTFTSFNSHVLLSIYIILNLSPFTFTTFISYFLLLPPLIVTNLLIQVHFGMLGIQYACLFCRPCLIRYTYCIYSQYSYWVLQMWAVVSPPKGASTEQLRKVISS